MGAANTAQDGESGEACLDIEEITEILAKIGPRRGFARCGKAGIRSRRR